MGFTQHVLCSTVIHVLPIWTIMTVISQYLPLSFNSVSYYFVMDITFQWEINERLFSTWQNKCLTDSISNFIINPLALEMDI